VFEEAFADFAKIGYNAVKADVPDGMEVQEYADWIGSYGLAPAISLFSSPFDETIDITKEVERAKRFAGAQLEHLAIENCGIVSQTISTVASVTRRRRGVAHTRSSPPANGYGASPAGESSISTPCSRRCPRITTATS
jgi:hypothetical protein